MRLIDADALITAIVKKAFDDAFLSGNTDMHRLLTQVVAHQPTIDAVPVIRCKDCKHWYEKYRHGVDMSACKRAIGYFGANDYCSRAVRKEE